MTFQQHIDALQSALAQTRTDFGGPAICSVMAEDLRVALHLIGQAALVPSAGSADSVRVVAWRARDGHGLPQTTWIDGDPGPQMESAWVGGDIECAYAGPVAAQAPIPEGQQPYPPTPAPDVQSSGEAEDSYSRAAVERAMRAAHDRGYSVGWDHGHAAQAPAAAMPDEIEGLRAHVALLKSALAQSERENDELRALAAAGDAQPAVWVAADTLNSPHPTCISALAYMSQLDRERGREYVPLYAAPQASEAMRDAGTAASDDVVLPPLPFPAPRHIRAAQMKEYARAAVLADRQQRAGDELTRLRAENQRLRNGVDQDIAEVGRLQALYDSEWRKRQKLRAAFDHPVFAFLLGEGPLHGVHFGDRHPSERGAYWWRKDLRAALSSPQAEQGERDAD
ncbi:hypothetical protein [Bordetella hinzii]|uniref:hypothetical protein n=1 Tax=Bordetella hinzii TaxID=103855 RepID=UPI001239C8E8|nr:hypothetical protein [Bordetella hinzii]MBZ0073658.1 hypothetical protein [Bordetella hinzii]MBZ0077866.1 hypothetical protein [Bordetella hinzii]MBZ0082455.1 hypothetical protein [Bordetella hinzii]QET42160.1 hypothetical protein FOB29_00320 [Bordetella hinzii]QWF39300.1 hypothetical protein HHA25_13900 [Bordetella hinzii]